MNDRLDDALYAVINNIKDDKIITALQAVIALNEDINYMDVNDWETYRDSDQFVDDMLAWFE